MNFGAMMNTSMVRQQFSDLLSSIGTAHPEMPLGDVRDLVDVAEFKVAFEILCDNLVEDYGWSCPRHVYADLVALARVLDIDQGYWQRFQPE
jgi:hypothetical protein